MRRCSIRALAVPPVLATLLLASAPPAIASCAPDPVPMTLREMIDQDTTGDVGFPIMFLGVVASWYDLGGKPGGGHALARVAVAEHPVGGAPLVSDVRFWRNYPRVSSSDEFEFKRDARYAVIAKRLDDGTFRFDGACGQTRQLNHERFRELVRYARTH